MSNFSSPVEVGSRLTSNFSRARRLFGIVRAHAGSDWAPKKSGDTTSPVHAVADGKVIAVGVGVLSGHSGLIVVIDHGIFKDKYGSDRTLSNYGHLTKTFVRVGDRVEGGEVIATQGKSGNVTGVHLHLGVRFNGVYSDPKKWLATKGIVPGKTAPRKIAVKVTPVASVKPASNAPKVKPVYSTSILAVQKKLKAMGYDIHTDGLNGSETKDTIKTYQKSQAAPYKLVADGIWGATTEAHYQWTLGFQKKINSWKSKYKKLTPDGHYGANTVARVRDIMDRNDRKAYKGRVDGVPGRVFCAMIGYRTHP